MPSDVRDVSRGALDDVPINVGFARAVVDGLVDGELWSDRADRPRAFHAVHPSGMSLVWGPDVEAAADVVARRIRERAARAAFGEWLQVEPRWDGPDWAGMVGAVLHTRVNFAFDANAFATRVRVPVPVRADAAAPADADTDAPADLPAGAAGTRVRRAREADFAWAGSTVPNRYWPDAASFLADGCGWVVDVDGTPAALAFRAFPGYDDVEIGIETHPDFRRRGLARLVTAAMIADVLATGRTPVWSCREENVGSVRLAASLGFTPSMRLPYLEVPLGGE